MAKKGGSSESTKQLAFPEAASLLRRAGMGFCETVVAGNEQAAQGAAARMGFPVFLKVVSPPASAAAVHKGREGLVAMADNTASFAEAYRRLSAAHAKLAARKVIERELAVAVQKEVKGLECFIGARADPSFGPVLVFGTGGVLAEDIGDVALRLCPVSSSEAAAMVRETRLHKRLLELKNSTAAIGNLAAALVKVSNLIVGSQAVLELDINPVMVSEDEEAVAVDVRVVTVIKKAKGQKAKKEVPSGKLNISGFFNPQSVALLGASRSPESVGQSILRNLTIGCVHRCEYCRPFLGKIFPVNPFASEILGFKSYPSILKIAEPVDLAIIALPRDVVLGAVDECIRKKVKAVIIISAGFGELDDKGRQLQEKVAEKLGKARIPLLGPNCLGIIRPVYSLNASFGPSMPPKGAVAFVSQSGALADSIIDWAIQSRYGLSALISYGNKAMLDCYDFFDFLANDFETKAVALYIEGLNDGRDFFEKLRQLAYKKPVVILKGGRTAAGVIAAATHTASLAGDAMVFEAAVRQAGAILAGTVEELFDLAKVLAEQPVCKGNGVGIITNGGGCGVICSDYCDELGVNLPQLQKSVIKAFDASGIMHPAYSRRNPLDIVGDAMPDRYELAINALLKEPYIHGLIVIQTLQAMTNSVLNAKAIVEAHKLFPDKPIISCFMGGRFSRKGMHYLDNMHIPDFNDIRKAVVAMKALIERGKFSPANASLPGAVSASAEAAVKGRRAKKERAGKKPKR
ncbi:acetate--CoA ligase family protein [Candidatus Woesearchaeota archaeon]|nr:acetate--CoA ligase family protein [Candidatus Woesearchaeota archaeon]